MLLLGPRQCGKTTLARQFAAKRKAEYFDLKSPADAARLAQPMTALEPMRGWVVMDEAQLKPELFAVLRVLADREAYFWNTQDGAELDLLVFANGRRIGFEFKYADAPAVTKSLHIAHADLKLEPTFIAHPGGKSFPLNDWAEAVAMSQLKAKVEKLVQKS